PLEQLRRAIGFVPQDTFLFSDTVKENIAFGIDDGASESVGEAAQIASLWSDIQSFPKQLETVVGERGITLSGGQKQRTALARAVIRSPRILILDDALSSVDTDTEEKILRRLKDVMRARTTILISHRCIGIHAGERIIEDALSSVDTDTEEKILRRLKDVMRARTTILISHRCSTVRHADQIVVLREGRIVERGTHDELLQHGGYYYDLYQKQLLEEELERA